VCVNTICLDKLPSCLPAWTGDVCLTLIDLTLVMCSISSKE